MKRRTRLIIIGCAIAGTIPTAANAASATPTVRNPARVVKAAPKVTPLGRTSVIVQKVPAPRTSPDGDRESRRYPLRDRDTNVPDLGTIGCVQPCSQSESDLRRSGLHDPTCQLPGERSRRTRSRGDNDQQELYPQHFPGGAIRLGCLPHVMPLHPAQGLRHLGLHRVPRIRRQPGHEYWQRLLRYVSGHAVFVGRRWRTGVRPSGGPSVCRGPDGSKPAHPGCPGLARLAQYVTDVWRLSLSESIEA